MFTIEKGQNDITKTIQEIAASVTELLKEHCARKETTTVDYDKKIQNLRREFNSAMEKNAADIQAGAMEMLRNRCDYQDEDDVMSEVSRICSHDSNGNDSDASGSSQSRVSVTNIPYANMAQFGATPADESTLSTTDGHQRQKRPITDVTISGSG